MPIQTNIKFKVFLKILEKEVDKKFVRYDIIQKRGSGIRIEVFKGEEDIVPTKMWVVHTSRYLYSDDLKKCCKHLEMGKREFLKLFKK